MASVSLPRRAVRIVVVLAGSIAVAVGTGGGVTTAHAPGVSTATTVDGRLAVTAARHLTDASLTPPVAATPLGAPAPAAHRAASRIAGATLAHAVAPRPVSYRSRLVSADGSLNTGVGYYTDCSGRTPLTHSSAAIDTCVGGRTYFVGHNPGVFTPLFHMGVGSIITWFDGAGNAHRLRIIGVRTWYSANGVIGLMPGATAEFQTCVTADGSVDRVMDAAPA